MRQEKQVLASGKFDELFRNEIADLNKNIDFGSRTYLDVGEDDEGNIIDLKSNMFNSTDYTDKFSTFKSAYTTQPSDYDLS